jgi:hypothetical protein
MQSSLPSPSALRILGVILASCAGAAALHGQANIVSWGPSTGYVTANQALNNWAGTGKTFSTSDSSSPTSNYSTPSGLSATFYGGGSIVSTTGTGSFNTRNIGDNVANGGGNDVIRFIPTWSGTNAANQQMFYAATVFKKSDFLNYSSQQVQLASSNSFNITWYGTTNFSGSSNVRLIVQDGSSWYLSSSLAAINVASLTSTTGNFSSLTWSAYDPTTSLSTIGSSATPTLDNVNAIGYLMTVGSTSGNNGNTAAFLVNQFNITATAIPEPSTYAALAGALALVGVMVQRRRRAAKPAGAA